MRIDPPLAKHPKLANEVVAAPPATPPSNASERALQAALLVGLVGSKLPGKNGIPVGVDLKSCVFP